MDGLAIPIVFVLTFFHYNEVVYSYLTGKTASDFFAYGDRNGNGEIDTEELRGIHNEVWTSEWAMVLKIMPASVQNTGVVTLKQFMKSVDATVHLRVDAGGMG